MNLEKYCDISDIFSKFVTKDDIHIFPSGHSKSLRRFYNVNQVKQVARILKGYEAFTRPLCDRLTTL